MPSWAVCTIPIIVWYVMNRAAPGIRTWERYTEIADPNGVCEFPVGISDWIICDGNENVSANAHEEIDKMLIIIMHPNDKFLIYNPSIAAPTPLEIVSTA